MIIRDIALYGKRSFSELLESAEHVATNVLSDRLARLEANDLISKTPNPSDRRKNIYRLTGPGKDLLPILLEMILWSAKYDPSTNAPPDFVDRARRDRDGLIAELRERIERVDEQR